MKKAKYSFEATIWKYKGNAGWYFVTLPKLLSKEIRNSHGRSEEGWGRLKALAQIGKSKWSTAIWFDSKAKSYLLPIKSEIRKKENAEIDSSVKVRLEIEVDKRLLGI